MPIHAQTLVGPSGELPHLSVGNTAWMIVATALVMLMTIPGLAFFYGGLVRRKNILNILMQCLILVAAITLEWMFFGYSNAFGSSTGALKGFIGGFDWAFLKGIKITDLSPYAISMPNDRIPHILFILYQCMFAVITPALIIGAFAERIKFKGFLIFSVLWAIIVYNPVAHWIWSSDGWLYKMGAIDFAGGIVVHINAGISALLMAILLGPRRYYENHPTPPHNIPFVVLGTGLLWFGWFGFNAGSGLAADGLAANAFLVTHVAAAAAAFTWTILDWAINKKPTTVGICTGAIAGLAAITPAAGFVDFSGALIISVLSAMICYYMVGTVKIKLKYDDSLDAFGVHGIGGLIGSVMVGVLATPSVQSAYTGSLHGNMHQLWIQLLASGVTILFSGVMTYILFKLVEKFIGIRADETEEADGLDLSQHNEFAYTESE
ncbi:MAG: ammonium transporter [Bacteroidota bacterium]|nr:ammonium transporter [Bacteroidota bacterium]